MKNMICYHTHDWTDNVSQIDTAEFYIDDVKSHELAPFMDIASLYDNGPLDNLLVVTDHEMTREEFIDIAKRNGLKVELDLDETHPKYEDLKDHFGVS